jgi:hypothetical protein
MIESTCTKQGGTCFSGKENRMIKFDMDIHIYRSLQHVFAFVVTPENDFHWQYGTLMSAQISNGEVGIGTLFRVIGHFMGRRMESVYEVNTFEPNKRYGFKSQSGSPSLQTLYTFDVIKGRTVVSVSVRLDPGNAPVASDSATEKSVKKQYRENLALLKDILETNGSDKSSDAVWLVSDRRR